MFVGDSVQDYRIGEDRFDLSTIDADVNTTGDQAFTYIGDTAFTGQAGELRVLNLLSVTYVEGDVNGDGTAGFQFSVNRGSSIEPLPPESDFIL